MEDIDKKLYWLLKKLLVLITKVTEQKGHNTINISGNNNEVQVPNEAGPGNVEG